VVGNGVTANQFDLTIFLPYRETTPWGAATPWISKRQRRNFFTYGCNAIYRNFRLDFVSCVGDGVIKEIAETTKDNTGVVFYANSKFLELYPDKFSFLPQNPNFNAGAMSAYMAAFDGHKRIFMLGFDGIDTPNNTYNMFAGTNNYPPLDYLMTEDYWVVCLKNIMETYSDTEFIRVCPTKKFRTPEAWKNCLNFKQIDFRQFVSAADI
jgi:hypothetical protein